MKVSWNIVLALNSIIDGKPIRGIRLNAVNEEDKKTLIHETIRQMKDNGLLSENGQLTLTGEMLARILRDYKKTSISIFINRMRIGLCYGDICPAVIPQYVDERLESVDLRYVNKKAVLVELTDAFPTLKGGHLSYPKSMISTENIALKMTEFPENQLILLASESNNKRKNENYVYLINDKTVNKIDVYNNTIQEVGGGDVRYQMACMLGLAWM